MGVFSMLLEVSEFIIRELEFDEVIKKVMISSIVKKEIRLD